MNKVRVKLCVFRGSGRVSRVSFIGHPALLLLQSQIDLQSDFICFDRKSNGCPNLKLKLNVYLKKELLHRYQKKTNDNFKNHILPHNEENLTGRHSNQNST